MQCLICKSSKTKIIRTKLRHDIKRNVYSCAVCGHAFLDPSKNTDKKFYVKGDYRGSYGPVVNKISSSKQIFEMMLPFQDVIIREISRILKPNMKVLDVGCSTGHFLYALKGRVKERVGLELQEESAKFIRKNLDFKIYNQSIEEAKIKEAPFDLVTCLQVLEHVENPLFFLQNIGRNLKSNGYLYVEVPNVNDVLLSCYKVNQYSDFHFREPHLSYFSIDSLKILMHQAGFKGIFKTVQRYNVLNHLHWIFTGSPQPDFVVGNSETALISNSDISPVIRNDLNSLVKLFDEKYKKLLFKHDLGENISFLGRKVNN